MIACRQEISKDTALDCDEVDSSGQSSNQISESGILQRVAPTAGSWMCRVCMVPNSPDVEKCAACESVKEVSPPPTDISDHEPIRICSPDSSAHRNPLLRFPLNMSPVSTLPYICPKPLPALEKEQVLPEEAITVTQPGSTEVFSKLKASAGTETETPLALDSDQQTSSKASKTITTDSEEVLSESKVHNCVKSVSIDTQDDDVVFLFEELPENDLIETAKKFLLPLSFFLYEKKAPCPGCRGCKLDSEESFSEDSSTAPDLVTAHTSGNDIVKEADIQCPSSTTQVSTSFGFSTQSGSLSFSDLTSKGAGGFAKTTPGFQFHDAGKQLFSATSAGEDADPEAEADVSFKPIVTLSEAAPIRSWDDDADALFIHRGRLYRFCDSQWKERGVGDIKIMKHRQTNRTRIIMRRDQIWKVCCNHYITAGMTLVPGSNEKSWVWFTHSDFTDEKPQPEKLAVRFKKPETAAQFKRVFEECVRDSESRGDEDSSTSPPNNN